MLARVVLQGLPSRIGHLLDISLRDLEAVLYFESYVVVDPGDAPVKEREIIKDETKFRELDQQYRPSGFRGMMGAEAIKELLKRVEVNELSIELRERMKTETSLQKRLKYSKRLKVVEAFRKSGNKPQWMILDVIPVIPPELRPLVPARRRTVRDFRPERPVPPRDQPQQPPQEAHGPPCA